MNASLVALRLRSHSHLIAVISRLICRLPLIKFTESAGVLLHIRLIVVLHPYLVVTSLVHHELTAVHTMGVVIVNTEDFLLVNGLHLLAGLQIELVSFIVHDLS